MVFYIQQTLLGKWEFRVSISRETTKNKQNVYTEALVIFRDYFILRKIYISKSICLEKYHNEKDPIDLPTSSSLSYIHYIFFFHFSNSLKNIYSVNNEFDRSPEKKLKRKKKINVIVLSHMLGSCGCDLWWQITGQIYRKKRNKKRFTFSWDQGINVKNKSNPALIFCRRNYSSINLMPE